MGEHLLEESAGQGVLKLSGAFTIEHAEDLHKTLLSSIERFKKLVLDISEVERVDVSFFLLMKSLDKTIAAKGGTLERQGSVPRVVLETAVLTGVTDEMEFIAGEGS